MGTELSAKTLHAYTNRISFLTDPDGLNLDVHNPAVTIPAIMKLKKVSGTLVGYFVALRYASRNDETISKQYTTKITELNKANKQSTLQQSMTEREKKKYGDTYPTWESILDFVTKIKTDTSVSDSDKLLLDLYTLTPPKRLDYINFHLYKRVPKVDTGNYAVLRKTKPYININDHKTAKDNGPIQTPISKELYTSITEYMKKHTDSSNLWNINDYTMSKLITGLFSKVTNKPITVNTLRHAYDSFTRRGDIPLIDKINNAKAMGHSVMMGDMYRRT
jgi:hypothetical protein